MQLAAETLRTNQVWDGHKEEAVDKPLLLSAMFKSLRWKTDTLFKTEISGFLEITKTGDEPPQNNGKFKQPKRGPHKW